METKQEYSLSLQLFSVIMEVLDSVIRQGKEVKGIEMQKKMKIAFIHDDLIPYLENPDITNNK